GEIQYASAGNGTGQQLSVELFKLMTGVDLAHVPYRGAAPAYADVISGRVPVFFDNLASGLSQVQSGNVRALAVAGSDRSALWPGLPTAHGWGVAGHKYSPCFGLWARRRTPEPIIVKLSGEVHRALADPGVKERIAASAGEPSAMARADIEPFVQSEIAK